MAPLASSPQPYALSSLPSLSLLIDCPHAFALKPRCLSHTYPTPRLIGLQRKLHIPPPLRCCCSGTIDITANIFACTRSSKNNLHNRVRDSSFLMPSHDAPVAQLVSAPTDVAGAKPTASTFGSVGITLPLSPATGPNKSVSHLDIGLFRAHPVSPLYPAYLSSCRRRNTPCPRTQ
jgi:hypothetical protein